MMRSVVAFVYLLLGVFPPARAQQPRPNPSFDYETARAHEIKPHRGTFPIDGVQAGFNQLRVTLMVSPAGDVVDADADGDTDTVKFWPQLEAEVREWKFTPFEKNGHAVTATVEEYVDLVPPERLPKKHVAAPVLLPTSKVTIVLQRTGCLGFCPSYIVTVRTDGIEFDGRGNVVASGKHVDVADPDEVRNLAAKFVAADFYSMDAEYSCMVTDQPTYVLSVEIDGKKKQVVDYLGVWKGMPAVIAQLEEDVDDFARTSRWTAGSEGLVQALQAERYNFKSFGGQIIAKEVAANGMAGTLSGLLGSGVPITRMPAGTSKLEFTAPPFADVGWLDAASSHPETLRLLISAGASKFDQSDKDVALAGAARSGK